MNDPLDRDGRALRAALSTLRRERGASAGAFADTVRRGRVRQHARRTRSRRRLAVGLAAALPLATVLALEVRESLHQREALALALEVAPLAQWRSPTGALLDDSHIALLRGTPALRSSILDPVPETEGVSP